MSSHIHLLPLQPNHDYCDACNGKGQFVCCDGGCLRSFHLTCLEPPLDIDQVPEDSWYCKACKAEVVSNRRYMYYIAVTLDALGVRSMCGADDD